jgi:hypothetical protein
VTKNEAIQKELRAEVELAAIYKEFIGRDGMHLPLIDALRERFTELWKVETERDDLMIDWKDNYFQCKQQTASRCAEIVIAWSGDGRSDIADAIRKEFGLKE